VVINVFGQGLDQPSRSCRIAGILLRNRRWIVVVTAALLAGCGGGTGPDDDDNDPYPPDDPGTVAVTLITRSVDPAADAGQIYAYVGDVAISRSQMAALLNENAPTVRYVPGSSTQQATIQVPRGKTVTLFAVEFGTNGFGDDAPGEPDLTRAPRTATEFIGWVGAAATAEPGVASFVANSAITVTAEYDRMRSLEISYLGCRDIKVQTTGVGMLGFGPLVPDPAPDLTSTNAFTGISDIGTAVSHWMMVWAKQGTTITVRARQREDRTPGVERAAFMRWEGEAVSCGTNLNCQLPITSRNFQGTPAPIRQMNSYSLTNGGTKGCGCSVHPPGTCSILP